MEQEILNGALEQIDLKAVNSSNKLIKKWWFWVIILVVLSGITVGIMAVRGGFADPIDPDEYINIVKATKLSSAGTTYGEVFDNFFTDPQWTYLSENIVEFEGVASSQTFLLQFIVDIEAGAVESISMSIDGVAQNQIGIMAALKTIHDLYIHNLDKAN